MRVILIHISILWQIIWPTYHNRKELLNGKQITRRQYRTITEMLSLKSKTPFKKPTLYQQSSRGGKTETKNPPKPPKTPAMSVGSTQSTARKFISFQNYLRYSWLQSLPVYIDCLPQEQACSINRFLTQMKTIPSLQQRRIYTSSHELLQIRYRLWKKASVSDYRGYQGPLMTSRLPACSFSSPSPVQRAEFSRTVSSVTYAHKLVFQQISV